MYAAFFLLYSLTFSVSTDHRCTIDPNGGCVGGFAAVDQGSGIDPDGAHVSGVDPNGGGGAMDPNG